MTADELGGRMTADELMGWFAFDEEHVSDSWHQTALIVATLHNVFGFGNKTFRPSDFLPVRSKAVEPAGPEALKAKFASFRDRHNAKVMARQAP